jgi:hypothetical protein
MLTELNVLSFFKISATLLSIALDHRFSTEMLRWVFALFLGLIEVWMLANL